MSNQTDANYIDNLRGLKGRFTWVKRLIQPRSHSSTVSIQKKSNGTSKASHRNHNQNANVANNRHDSNPSTSNNNHAEDDQRNNQSNNDGNMSSLASNQLPQRNNQLVTRFDLDSEADDSFNVDPSINQSVKTSSKAPSITHDSINTRTDNVSTLPVISMSTMSVRSSTFSEHSEPSTSGTIFSDHPTVYTNASTVGIPPASIIDRRERLHHPISLNNYHLTVHNNNSTHTVNTATTPTSTIPNEYSGDMSSMKS